MLIKIRYQTEILDNGPIKNCVAFQRTAEKQSSSSTGFRVDDDEQKNAQKTFWLKHNRC